MTTPRLAPISTIYKPSPWQLRFHNTKADFVFGAGSAGPGKSLALLFDPWMKQIPIEHARCARDPSMVARKGSWLWKLIEENPLNWGDSRGWALFLMRDLRRLDQTLQRARRFFPKIDPGAVAIEGGMKWTLSSGYVYQFGHCYEINDWQRYDSQQYSSVLLDEVTQFDEVQVDSIVVRCRIGDDPVLRHFERIAGMSNPQRESKGSARVRDPYWVRRRFVDPCPEGNKIIRHWGTRLDGTRVCSTRIYLPAKLSDNPDKDFVEQYERRLATSHRKHIVKAMLEGNWYVVPGAFYSEDWDPGLHVCKPFRAPREWKFFRSMDWGFKAPGVIHWWALTREDQLFCLYEYNFRLKSPPEVVADIEGIEKRLGLWDEAAKRSKITGPADTQIWEQRGDGAPSKAAQFMAEGVAWTKADKRSRQANAERLLIRLAAHENGPTGLPGIVAFDWCRKAIESIPSIPTDELNINVPQDGGEDHAHDSWLYACAYASRGFAALASLPETESDLDRMMKKVSREQGIHIAYGEYQ